MAHPKSRAGRGVRQRLRKQQVVKVNQNKFKRKDAVKQLNVLADELGLEQTQVPLKDLTATESKVEKLVRVLEPRCSTAALNARLRAAVQQWMNHSGFLSQPMTPAPSQPPTQGPQMASHAADSMAGSATDSTPDSSPNDHSVISQHKVLQPGYILKSKAFMLTFNDVGFTEDSWPPFLAWVKMKHKELCSRAWAACLEISEHAQVTALGKRYHLHAYLYWTDGVGTYHRNLDRLCLAGNTESRQVHCQEESDTTCGRLPWIVVCHTHEEWYSSGRHQLRSGKALQVHCIRQNAFCFLFPHSFKLYLQISFPMLTSVWNS